jgi:TolA-binding protein/S1-C subfamily serine protease
MKNRRLKVSHILSIVGMLILAFTLSSCALLFSTAEQVENIFLDAEASYRAGSYNAAIEKYQTTLKEFRKPGVAPGVRPHINKNFPTLINYRIAVCYSKLAEQSENSERFYSKAIEYAEKAAMLPFETKSNAHTPTNYNYTIYENSTIPYENYKAQSYQLWGELLYITGKFELAIKKFSEFIAYFPDSAFVENASYRIGVFYHKQGKHELSQIAFKRIINKFPSSRFKQEAHYRVAKLLLNEEDYGQAHQQFTRSLKSEILSPNFQEDALYHAAYCLYQLGRYNEALNQYTTFTARYPKSQHIAALPQYTFSIGKLYFQKERYKEALSNYQSALQNIEKQPLKTEIQLAIAEAHLAIGKVYFGKKDYGNALSTYQLALQNTEKQPLKTEIRLAITEAHLAIGKVYFRDKDYENALSSYQLALRNTEKQHLKTEIQLAMAFTYLNQRDAKNTTVTCKRILSVDMDLETMPTVDLTTEERRTIAKGVQLYLEAENTTFLAGYKGAVAKYNAALTKIQGSISTTAGAEYQADLNYILGNLFYKVERFKSAEQQLTKVISDFPDSNFVDDAWYAIGDMNYKLQSYTECRDAFRKILESFPNSDLQDDAQYFVAKSLLEELDYEGAYLAFDGLTTKRFQKYPDFQDDTRYHAAYCLSLLGRDDMAIRRYENFLEHYPQSPYRVDAYFDLGTIYARQQNYENARSNYALAMQHTDDQALLSEIQVAIGQTHYNQGNYKNAIVAHTVLLEKYPESDFIIEAKLGIANSHFRMRTWQEAADAYERIIKEHPEATNFTPYCAYQVGEAHCGLATYHSKQDKTELAVKNFHEALEWYQRIIDDFPAEDSNNLGEITELLITSLTRMRNDSSVPEELQSLSQLKKGDCYLATEQYGKALAEYNTFVQMFPNSTRGSSVQDRIKQVQESIISKNLREEKVRKTVEVPIEQQIAQKALASTVLILTTDANGYPMALGSGFFINDDQIVSNWHIVEGATTAYALSVDEKTRYKIEGMIAMNSKQDLVILKVSGEGSPLPLGDSNIVSIGESIYVTGNPKGWTGTFSIGVISSFQMRYAGKRIQITAPVSPGSSGGPVLNDKGEVIGIVYAVHGGPDAQNLNLAIPVNYLKALLKRVGSPIPLSAR